MLNPSKAATASVTSTTTITPATIGIEAAVSSTRLKGPCGRIWKMNEIKHGSARRCRANKCFIVRETFSNDLWTALTGLYSPLRQPREAPDRWFEAAQANS
jgi:hypothetical protein